MQVAGPENPNDEVRTVILAAMRGELSQRDLAMIGFGTETKKAIQTAIEVNPAMEETFFHIADLAYLDGAMSK